METTENSGKPQVEYKAFSLDKIIKLKFDLFSRLTKQ